MKKEKIIELIEILKKSYPDAKCSLDFTTPFEMVAAVMLSAQCTDDRVNLVTPTLFAKYPNIEDYAKCDLSELENIIHSCGFYKNKAKNLKACAQKILDTYNGKIPNTMEELITLPGIGRKSANVIMLEVFNNPQGIAVDTHVKRISNKIGLSSKKEPEQIELDLLKQIPKKYYTDVNHLFIYHGRHTCMARSPKCDSCPVAHLCESSKLSELSKFSGFWGRFFGDGEKLSN